MIVPLILSVVAVDPSVSNKTLRSILEQYGKLNFMTDSIIQEACTQARMELFRTPDTNINYVEAIMNEMKNEGPGAHCAHEVHNEERDTQEYGENHHFGGVTL